MKLFLICCLFAISGNSAAAQSPLDARQSDNQIWTDAQIAIPLDKKVDLIVGGALRFGRNLEIRTEERASVGAAFKPAKFYSFTPLYAQIGGQTLGGRRLAERRLIVNNSFRFPAGKFTVNNRNLIEHRRRTNAADSTRFRARLSVERQIKTNQLDFNFFAANEVFYDFAAKSWTRNRFSVGANRRLAKNLVGEIYYLRQTDGRIRPGNLNVVGFTLRANLDLFFDD